MTDGNKRRASIAVEGQPEEASTFVPAELPCPYFPGRVSLNEVYMADELPAAVYESLMGLGFRRSGRVLYRPCCDQCNGCQAIRVRVDRFERTRSMRRVWTRNVDVRVECVAPDPTPEKYDIYVRYLEAQHDDTMSRDFEPFIRFLYDSPVPFCEFDYFLGDRLVGVSLADRCPRGLSSVYMFFDADHAERSLGTFSILWEIEHCRKSGLPYYYLGFYIEGCKTMAYKDRFRPNEVLDGRCGWVPFREH